MTDRERCFIGAEPYNGGRDLLRLAHPADRLLRDAVARPMPLLAPVTNATFPSKRPLMGSP